VLGILYCLLGFAIVCEEYFVASLLVLGAKFKLSDDVNGTPKSRARHCRLCRLLTPPPVAAGATLMAAGSSMPEVFSSLVSLFSASTDNSLGMV
jgi:sodium/potassium/calcium exchanger 4